MTVGEYVRDRGRRGQTSSPPLAGVSAASFGASTSLAVAAEHLTLLGCAPADRSLSTGTEPGDAATIVATAGTGRGRAEITCAVDWAGPVALPLAAEAEVQAACGIAQVHGRRYGRPTLLPFDYAAAVTGVLAVHGVLAALHSATRGVRIRQVRTSVAQGALLAMSQYLAAASGAVGGTGDEPTPAVPLPAGPPDARTAPPFTSADDVTFEIETLDAEDWHRFWRALGVPHQAISRGWRPFQYRYAAAVCPLPDELRRGVAAHPYPAIVAAAAEAGVSVVPVRGLDAADALASGAPWTITELPADGHAAHPAAPGEPTPTPTPTPRHPLGGLVVVESTRRVQGPLAGHVLALLGARVIRVEPPGGDPARGVPPLAGDCSARFLALNRDKEVVEADLHTLGGRSVLRELAAGADVFLHNWAPGKAAAWELDAEDLAAVRPGLVYAWASGWGEAFGPTPPLGTDYLVQAGSGLAGLTARPGEPPTPSLMTLLDVLGGLVCAEGVLAALLARTTTGRGRRVDTSLLSAASVLTRHGRATADASHAWATADAPHTRVTADALHAPASANVPHGPVSSAALCTDLTELIADPRFATALTRAECTLPNSPWEFSA
ncbi:CoA transferase [Streptomyces sporangiiformans]|uniref:CoA transferase n=2 Tax=Streptomyces sporangiiformans TaxID=2315329 RepID=A0A505DQZ7_9ACTN|nr:CoA transferase [Streptomyces sporangiiformans]